MSALNLTPVLEGYAASLLAEGKLDEALQAGAEGLATAREALKADERYAPLLVQALENFAEIKREAGQLDEAVTLYQEAIESAAKAGLEPGVVAQIRTSLATTLDLAGREDEALPVFEQAIKDLEALEPPDNLTAAQLRNNVAMTYKNLNKLPLAEQHYLRALEVLEAEEGESADLASIYNNLGALYYAAGFADQAKEMFEEAMRIREHVFGADHADVAQSHASLATVQHELGDDDAAQRSYEQALRILEANIETKASSYEAIGQDYIALLGSIEEDRKAAVFQKRMEKVLASRADT